MSFLSKEIKDDEEIKLMQLPTEFKTFHIFLLLFEVNDY